MSESLILRVKCLTVRGRSDCSRNDKLKTGQDDLQEERCVCWPPDDRFYVEAR